MDARIEETANRVIGAAIEVHRQLGPGYLESVYEEALAVELSLRAVPFAKQVAFGLDYKGNVVGEGRLDFLVDGCLIVELKAVEALAPIHTAQCISYLKTHKRRLALLINFNVPCSKTGPNELHFEPRRHKGHEDRTRPSPALSSLCPSCLRG